MLLLEEHITLMLLPSDIYQLLLGYLDISALGHWRLLNRREKERVERYAFSPVVIGGTSIIAAEGFYLSANYLILLYPSLSYAVVYNFQGVSLYSLNGFSSVWYSNANTLYGTNKSIDLDTGKEVAHRRYCMMNEPDASSETLDIQELELSLRFISGYRRTVVRDCYRSQGLARARLWGLNRTIIGLLLPCLPFCPRTRYLWFPLPLTTEEIALADSAFTLCHHLVIVFDRQRGKLSVFHGPLRHSWTKIVGYQVRYDKGRYALLLIGERIELYLFEERWHQDDTDTER